MGGLECIRWGRGCDGCMDGVALGACSAWEGFSGEFRAWHGVEFQYACEKDVDVMPSTGTKMMCSSHVFSLSQRLLYSLLYSTPDLSTPTPC